MSEKRTVCDGLAPKFKSKNFKIRRRSFPLKPFCASMIYKLNVCLLVYILCILGLLGQVSCDDTENDVLTLQDDLVERDVISDDASDRRRPSNDQEKDIMFLDALGRRKGYHNNYNSAEDDDSIMDFLVKSKFF